MLEHTQVTAERDVAWLASRQPAVIRLLEQRLAGSDGDALAAGLELVWSLLGEAAPWPYNRLDQAALAAGMAAVQTGVRSTGEMTPELAPIVRSLRAHIANLPLALSRDEQDAVVTIIAAVTWAAVESRSHGLDDTVLA